MYLYAHAHPGPVMILKYISPYYKRFPTLYWALNAPHPQHRFGLIRFRPDPQCTANKHGRILPRCVIQTRMNVLFPCHISSHSLKTLHHPGLWSYSDTLCSCNCAARSQRVPACISGENLSIYCRSCLDDKLTAKASHTKIGSSVWVSNLCAWFCHHAAWCCWCSVIYVDV